MLWGVVLVVGGGLVVGLVIYVKRRDHIIGKLKNIGKSKGYIVVIYVMGGIIVGCVCLVVIYRYITLFHKLTEEQTAKAI